MIDQSRLRYVTLGISDDVIAFDCDDSDLNSFLHHDALTDQDNCINVTRLVYFEDKLAGYYSVLNASIKSELLVPGDYDGNEYPSYPALKIGRMGVCKEYQKMGLGTVMLIRSISLAKKLSLYTGCRFVTVDAKTRGSSYRFYSGYGFHMPPSMNAKLAHRETVPMYLDILKYEQFL